MNYDTEKTQAPADPRFERQLRDERLKREIGNQMGRDTQGECSRPMSSEEVVAELFKYHPPNELTLPRFQAINQAAKNFAEVVLQNCPSSADRSAAIRQIREARMTANAAISLNGLSL